MTDLERVLQRLAQLLRGEEPALPAADPDTIRPAPATIDPAPDPGREAAPDLGKPGAARA